MVFHLFPLNVLPWTLSMASLLDSSLYLYLYIQLDICTVLSFVVLSLYGEGKHACRGPETGMWKFFLMCLGIHLGEVFNQVPMINHLLWKFSYTCDMPDAHYSILCCLSLIICTWGYYLWSWYRPIMIHSCGVSLCNIHISPSSAILYGARCWGWR